MGIASAPALPYTRTGPVRQTAREFFVAPAAGVAIVARTLAARPALFVALTLGLMCVPSGEPVGSPQVTLGDLGSVALVLAVAPRLLRVERLPRTRLWAPLAATVFAVALAAVTAPDAATGVTGFVRYLQIFVLVPVAVMLAIRDRLDLWLVCGSVLAAAVLEGAVGTWQYLTGSGASYAGVDVRAVGTFGALDIMGMSSVVSYGIVLALGLAVMSRGRRRLGLLLLAALLVVPLLLSLSRGALIATVGAIALLLLAANPPLALRTAVFSGAAAVVLLGAVNTAGGTVADRFTTIVSSVTGSDRSVNDRYELWQTATGMWKDRPLTGVGLKMFPAYRDSYAPLHLSSGSDVADPHLSFRRAPLLSPHNMYLLVLSEQGLIGAVAFLLLMVGVLVLAWRRTRRVATTLDSLDGEDRDARPAAAVAVGVLSWTLINFLFSDIGGQSTVLTALMIGLALWWAAGSAVHKGATR